MRFRALDVCEAPPLGGEGLQFEEEDAGAAFEGEGSESGEFELGFGGQVRGEMVEVGAGEARVGGELDGDAFYERRG